MAFTWPDLKPASAPAQGLVRRMSGSVAVANGLAMAGRPIDLHGLDGLAGMVCAQVMDLPPGESVAMRPALEDLVRDVSALIALMQSKHQ